MFVRICLSIILTMLFAGTAFGQCPLTFDESDQSTVGVYIAPLNGDSALVEYNSSTLLTPASVMKAVTAASVLSKYSGDYCWETTVMAVGRITDSILNGNIIIRGCGDPTIESKHFKGVNESFISSFTDGLRSHGIKRITGQVLLEKHWPDEGAVPSWELEDIPGIDGAGFYTLNYKDNIFSIEYPSLKVSPYIPGLNVTVMGGNGYLKPHRNVGSYDLMITGKLGKRDKKATLICSMPNPTEALLYQLNEIANADLEEIVCNADTIVIATHRSPQLRNVTRSYMVRSDNQMAEAALRLIAPGKSRKEALKAHRNILVSNGANIRNANIKDGSGLSRHNTISASQLGSILRLMSSNEDYVNSFARVGKDGTVKNFMKDKVGRENFVLKSGSMTGVVAYAGYRIDPESNEPTHVIAVIVNNAPYASKARSAIAELLSNLDFNL